MEKSFVTFEGPIASGKTTHAILLARRLLAEPVLEQFLENEFLIDFYKDRNRWAALMQLWFLVARQEQLRSTLTTEGPIIADYSPLKNGIFASALLNGRELRLYEQIAARVSDHTIRPTLMVYLDADNSILLSRIRSRNRAFESMIDGNYLDLLRQAYDRKFSEDPSLKVVRLSTSNVDLSSTVDVAKLQDSILGAL